MLKVNIQNRMVTAARACYTSTVFDKQLCQVVTLALNPIKVKTVRYDSIQLGKRYNSIQGYEVELSY
jgi:hypothetical protein